MSLLSWLFSKRQPYMIQCRHIALAVGAWHKDNGRDVRIIIGYRASDGVRHAECRTMDGKAWTLGDGAAIIEIEPTDFIHGDIDKPMGWFEFKDFLQRWLPDGVDQDVVRTGA